MTDQTNHDLAPVRVSLPLGIGDCHWAAQKLRGLKAYHGNAPLHCFVNESKWHATWPYLELIPFIDLAGKHERAVGRLDIELPPSHKDERWSTLEGSRGWNGFDYVVSANGHLESGKRIETFFPELPTDYTYDLRIPDEDRAYVRALAGERPVLLYPSGRVANTGFHANTFTVEHWVETIRLFNERGVEPVLVGANTKDDLAVAGWITRRAAAAGLRFNDCVGKTSIPQYCALIEGAASWTGLNSGGGIVAAHRGTPTVMFWSDRTYPIPGIDPIGQLFPEQQTSWLHESQLATYRVLSLGSPQLTPENIVATTFEVKR